jgi:hypothetical protein
MIAAASGNRILAIRLTKSMMSPFAYHPKQRKRGVARYGSIFSDGVRSSWKRARRHQLVAALSGKFDIVAPARIAPAL